MAKKSYLNALLSGKCPRCRQGAMFVYPISKITRFHVMHDRCPVCQATYIPEPGFYQGAMYVGYAFIVAITVAVSIVLSVAGDFNEWQYAGTVIALVIVFAPINYRYARIVYLHLFGGHTFDPGIAERK